MRAQTKFNYDVIVDHAHFRFLSEKKGAVGRIAKPGAVPLALRFQLLLQQRATTVATRSHWGSRNSYLYGSYKSLYITDSGNRSFLMT